MNREEGVSAQPRVRKNSFSKERCLRSYRFDLLAVPIFLIIAFFIQELLPVFSILYWLASLVIHECGHAIIGNLSGQLSIPTPFYTVPMSSEHSVWVILTIALILSYLTHLGLRQNLPAFAALCSALLTLQLALTFIVPATMAKVAIIYAGLGAELIASAVLMLLFYAPMPGRLNWNLNRYFILTIAALTFSRAVKMWISASGNPALLPLGAAIDFGLMSGDKSDGDLDRLIRDFGWNQAQIISVYLMTMWASMLILILGWCAIVCYRLKVTHFAADIDNFQSADKKTIIRPEEKS